MGEMTGLTLLDALSIGLGILFLLGCTYAAVVSYREGEPRATRVLLLLAILLPAPFLAAGFGTFHGHTLLGAILVVTVVAAAVALLIPTGGVASDDVPHSRIDERDIMFSRRLLEPGTERFDAYYAAHPEKKSLDDGFREKPGLLMRGSAAYDPHLFLASDAGFWTIEQLRPFVDGEPAAERLAVDPAAMTVFVKAWASKLGAVSAGVTRLRDYHVYSVVGRGPDYGAPVTLNHEYAIALTVEMDKRMVDAAPLAPTVMESAQQYVEAGIIAVQIAHYIRSIGYSARAHIDGNYRVVCPLVARDAGLGEIGRMGLLMTPRLGPRVRLGVVTTTLPLVPDARRPDQSVTDFCTHCRKCALACPSQAIPTGPRRVSDGVKRWRIDSEKCYTFWCHVGTDCARCLAVCPFSHPDNSLHNLVRCGVRNSGLFRRVATWADDVLYGRQPAPRELPDWTIGVSRRD